MQENTAGGLSLKLKSGKDLSKQEEAEISENLPMHVSLQLFKLMNGVVGDKPTPESVNAACNCAAQICKMIDLTMKAQRIK